MRTSVKACEGTRKTEEKREQARAANENRRQNGGAKAEWKCDSGGVGSVDKQEWSDLKGSSVTKHTWVGYTRTRIVT